MMATSLAGGEAKLISSAKMDCIKNEFLKKYIDSLWIACQGDAQIRSSEFKLDTKGGNPQLMAH